MGKRARIGPGLLNGHLRRVSSASVLHRRLGVAGFRSRVIAALLVIAMPLKGVMLSYSDTFGAKQVQGKVERRGLCGDVFLNGTPAGARIEEIKVNTSVRNWEILFDAALQNLPPENLYALRAQITDNGHGHSKLKPRVKL